ncbi:MAG: D-alanyl-D-alanine carboxypeptidase [Lachnospiraceae bacterium]|nr:D-alanyl-D-alanine carboxypeptidase [Lachnospiraceae bacterium]
MSGFRKYRENKSVIHNKVSIILAVMSACASLLSAGSFTVHASSVEAQQRLEVQRALEIQSNQVPNWPVGPVVGAESAILIDAETGTLLYAKNIHQKQYPASTTKILTALIASEQCQMDEIVTFSHDAVFDTPRDSSHIAMDVGQELTMEQSLNAILICSANEVCYAVAEHISGTTDWSVFAGMMNARAEELGCLNSHFANPNGLPDENHYTTAYDLAMIGRSFFANEMLCKITLTRRMEFPVTDKLPLGKLENNRMQIIPGNQYAYKYLVGCKTGYTDDARSSLVSCAEKNGMKLICVVLHDEAPYQYEDTIALFEYGFSNFEKVNVSQTETKYNIDNTGLFYSGNDIFGSSQPILSLNRDDYIILPKTISFQDTESAISYESGNENQAAVITYSYHGVDIGTVKVDFNVNKEEGYVFDVLPEEEEKEEPVIFVNVAAILIGVSALAVILFIVLLARVILRNYSIQGRSRRRRRRRQQRARRRRRAGRRGRDHLDFF